MTTSETTAEVSRPEVYAPRDPGLRGRTGIAELNVHGPSMTSRETRYGG